MSDNSAEAKQAVRAAPGKYLTFRLGAESYGIAVLKIREIIQRAPITAVPQLPDYVCGVINLRGKIIPVTDLRRRFATGQITDTEQACIIVVQVRRAEGQTSQMGLTVDGVEDVVNLTAADIEATPDFGAALATDYILGLAKIKDAIKTLLDIDKIVATGVPA